MMHGSRRSTTKVAGVLFANLMLVLALVTPQSAYAQIPNAVYEGSHSGGGTIKITVGGDGRTLVKTEIYNVPSDICTWGSVVLTAGPNPPTVQNGEFDGIDSDGTEVKGRFVSNTRIEGTFIVKGTTQNGRFCTSPTYSYSATTGAPAPTQPRPSPPVTQPAPPPPPATSGNFCRPGESPKFQFGFLALKELLGDVMGDPVECEHPNSANGDTLQRTTRGLVYYRKATNTPTFTNGAEHWAITPRGLLYWVGPAVDPP
ncbi:MAG: hypothetical protein U0893_24690 [Chloroflexota bacterium]